jgi:hypothetical protein
MLQTDVLVMLLDPDFSLPNVNLTTFAGYAVHAWSLESQVILHGLVIFLTGRPTDMMLCLDSIGLM